jgi:hypothetical protein
VTSQVAEHERGRAGALVALGRRAEHAIRRLVVAEHRGEPG